MSEVGDDGAGKESAAADPDTKTHGAGGARELVPVDAVGLAYEARGGRITVHYPLHDAAGGGWLRYGTGFDTGPIPESYWTDPPNEITRQRVAIWRTLLEGASAVK